MEYVFNLINANIELILLLFSGLIVLLLVLIVFCLIKIKKLKKRYDFFMGANRRPDLSLETKLNEYSVDVKDVKERYNEVINSIEKIEKNVLYCSQKVGIVRYNPFDEMGGNLCFAIAILDGKDNGVVINGIYNRTGSFTYGKPVENGESSYALSDEEKQAISKAKENYNENLSN